MPVISLFIACFLPSVIWQRSQHAVGLSASS
jgi:hypothetical protein